MTAAAPLADLADFSDRLSPMVVKELRQGLRTRMFRVVLLVLHLLLILITLLSGAARNPDDVRWMLDGLSILALCVALPLCGFSAVAAEMKSKTLETLVLTHLSAIRIVVGKWASLALQSLLIAVSLVPYYIARYGLTGSDLPTELLLLGGEWLLGVVIAAAIVCLSTQKAFWLRALVVAFMLIVPSMMGMLAVVASRAFGGPGGYRLFGSFAFGAALIVLVAVVSAVWLVFYFLTLGATRIAPAASNLAAVKRVVHLGVISGLALTAFLAPHADVWLQAASVVAYLASVDALIENRNEVPSPLIPFYRRGWLGRLVSWFLAPGWPSGVLFSLLIAGVSVTAAAVLLSEDRALHILLDIAGVWLCAFVLHISGARHWRDLLAPYIGISFFIGLIGMIVMMVSNVLVMTTGSTWLGMLLPGTAAVTLQMATASSKLDPGEMVMLQMTGVASGLVWGAILLIMAALVLRRLGPVRAEARLLAETSPS